MSSRFSGAGRVLSCIGFALALVLCLSVAASAKPDKGGGKGKGGGGNDGGDGRLSPPSLDVDTCGCPTTFSDPYCQGQTGWMVEKDATVDAVADFAEGPLFEVRVIEGQTRYFLKGSGRLVVTNSGGQPTYLTSAVLNLEEPLDPDDFGDELGGGERGSRKCSDGRDNDRDGFTDGDDPDCFGNWVGLASALVNEQGTSCGNSAGTCEGTFVASHGSSLVLFDEEGTEITSMLGDHPINPGTDNDGDGRIDEDPPYIEGVCFGIYDDDGDGRIDEDPGLIDDDGDGLFNEDCPDDDGDGLIDEDTIAGIDDDGDGLIDEDPFDGVDNDGDTLIDEDDPDDDGDGLVDEDDQMLDNDGDGAADEDCFYQPDRANPGQFLIEGDGIDNDGDGLTDEDGADDDRDGLLDEDSGCDDTTVITFDYAIDITDLGIEAGDGVVPSADDLRVEILATFKAGGDRGGICQADTDCDGNIDEDENYVRTVLQRHQFDPPACEEGAPCPVHLVDAGAEALDPGCVEVVSDTLDESVPLVAPGNVTTFPLNVSVQCVADCGTTVTNTAELDFDTLSRVQPALDDLAGDDGIVRVTPRSPGDRDAYFEITVTGAGELDGTYDSWCIDTSHTIVPGRTYCAKLVSSFDDLPGTDFVDYPQNLDNVNWLINNFDVGQPLDGLGAITLGDVQRSIWAMLEFRNSTAGIGPHSNARVDYLVEAACGVADVTSRSGDAVRGSCTADSAGQGFESDCDQDILVALQIVRCDNFQPLLTQLTTLQLPLGGVSGIPGVCDCVEGVVGEPAMASFPVSCNGFQPNITPGDFCSQTQGGYGQCPAGGNTGALLHDNFAYAFPGGLTIGDEAIGQDDGLYGLQLATAQDVTDFLPANGTPGVLAADQINPGTAQDCPGRDTDSTTAAGVFAGQLAAATINVRFDALGIGKVSGETFPAGTLATLVYGDCVVEALQGRTVLEILQLSNTAIAGGGTPAGVSVSNLSDALAVLNEEFVDCTNVATGCLTLP